ncbi:hypothetical protein AB1285_27115 [Microbacterium sp. NRRL B-14842]|uniref:hypothetical protein n=2 Tax=Microbacterium sp. NRRL B-14842 TaxID=3162881 RepID=UPI003D29301F
MLLQLLGSRSASGYERLEQDAAGEGIAGVLEGEQLEQERVALFGSLRLPDEVHGLIAGQLAERSEVVSGVGVEAVPLVEQLVGKR